MSISLPKIFLDSSDPGETTKAKGLLGKIDGQTTNPSLVAKNPQVKAVIDAGKTLDEPELLARYKEIVQQIARDVAGPISIEVYADWNTSTETMLKQAEEMATWCTNATIKFPTIPNGVAAAHAFAANGGSVNMTLVFDQNQAASAYAATIPIEKGVGGHFVSPFIGRWDDRGVNGIDLIKNIIKMYKKFDTIRNSRKPHIEVLAASIRSLEHFYASIVLGADAVTIPLRIISEWIADEKWMPDEKYRPDSGGKKALIYEDIPLQTDFSAYRIEHTPESLLSAGLETFATDWNRLLGK